MKRFRNLLVFASIFCFLTLPLLADEDEDQAFLPLIEKAKNFVSHLEQKEFEKAMQDFDQAMTAAMPAEKLEQLWKTLNAQVGSFEKQLGVRTEKAAGYKIIYVVCKFKNGDLDVKVVFNKDQQIGGLFFLPSQGLASYQAPDYAEDKFFELDTLKLANEWGLPATLAIPDGEGPFPAVILVHGSGPNDRDESIGPNKPFRDLAWGLASNGIAVLRYDKRTYAYPAKMDSLKNEITVMEETIDDALAAVTLLRKSEGIDPDKIIVLGHSLGGMLIPKIASLYPRIAGTIIMAGPSRPLEDLLPEQFEYIFSLDGELSTEEQNQLTALMAQIQKVKNPQLAANTAAHELPLGIPANYWIHLRSYNQTQLAAKLRKPMLVLQGERDYQVTMTDFDGWKQNLASRQNVSFKSYPDLNHLFIAGSGKSRPAEYMLPGNVSEQVIKDISAWINSIF